MDKVVVVLSGGLDSTTLLYDIINQGFDVNAISFHYNQKHKIELSYAMKTTSLLGVVHKVLDLHILNEIAPSSLTRMNQKVPKGHYADESMKKTVVPNRNMVLLSLATSYAIGVNAKSIYYGAHSGDHAIYPDCRPEFIQRMQSVIKLCDWSLINLYAPYQDLDKGDIIKIGKKLNVDYSLTWTCYDPQGSLACGKCGSCTERLEAFKKADLIDPIKYA